MTNEQFPSGPWIGFYTYYPGDRHRMDLHLTFANGSMSGDGNDDIGRFLIKGHYDSGNGDCYWTKTYVGAHDVFYRGFREGKGIWGTWEITQSTRGGFHIWPRLTSPGDQAAEHSESEESVDAVAEDTSRRTLPATFRQIGSKGADAMPAR
jgi:hypothetical protein